MGKLLKRHLNKKGSAMVLVMSALIILMAVSTVVLALSAANIRMSGKYNNWSKDYYWLDYAAQDRLSNMDKSALIPAENLARSFLEENDYQHTRAADIRNSQLQPLFSGGSNEYLLGLINDKWNAIESMLPTDSVPTDAEQQAYSNAMKNFVPQVFNVVYAASVQSSLGGSVYAQPYPDGNGLPAGMNYSVNTNLTLNGGNGTVWFTPPSSAVYPIDASHPGSAFDQFYSAFSAAPKPAVNITATEAVSDNGKKVEVNVTVNPPSYNAVTQTRYFAVKANPLYANAISAQGSVTFQGSGAVGITGDIVSCARDAVGNLQSVSLNNQPVTSDTEGNGFGIKTLPGANITINGNIYCGGDVHLWGSNSSITVNSNTAGNALKTNLLYSKGNNYWFDKAAAPTATNYAWDSVNNKLFNGLGSIPYIYNDSTGGNVYCNNLAIENGVINGSINVSGDVWTQDDLQNDGQVNTGITVNGNYIGMNSDAKEDRFGHPDPNGSSAVVNNAMAYEGTITIGGQYVIPGTAFYLLYSDSTTPVYYQSAESLNAAANDFLQTYIFKTGDSGVPYSTGYYITQNGSASYYFYNYADASHPENALKDRIARFQSLLGQINGVNSHITVSTSAARYVLGVGLNSDGTIIENGASSDPNHLGYEDVSAKILPDVFTAKTKFFGTNGYKFTDLLDSGSGMNDGGRGFYYYPADAVVSVASVTHGIIYCDGNLHLTGSGTFNGSVICKGDLTVDAGVRIVYSDAAIQNVLGLTAQPDGTYALDENAGSQIARRFFSPGTYKQQTVFGVDSYNVTTATAGELANGKSTRYIINSWKEISNG